MKARGQSKPAQEKAGGPSGESGFVLVATIWVCGLLALATIAFTVQAKTSSLLARNIVFGRQAQAYADGMVTLLAARLSSGAQTQVMSLDGTPAQCVWPKGIRILYAIQDQAGLIDLNAANPGLVAHALAGLGASQADSASLAQAIDAFKTGSKGAPFETPDELDQLPGIGPALFAKLRAVATVYSQSPGLDPQHAPNILKQALQSSGLTPEQYAAPSPNKTFAIDVVAVTEAGAKFHRHVVIALVQQPNKPFAVLDWEQAKNAGEAQATDAAAPPCFK